MNPIRATQKFERITITLVPTSDERGLRNIPTTFDKVERTYEWRHFQKVDYMIVPCRVAVNEIKVDMFIAAPKKGKTQGSDVQKIVKEFVQSKLNTEWMGLKLLGISTPSLADPPDQTVRRGSIEEMLGANLDR